MLEIIEKGQKNFINNYKQFPIVFEKGEGVYLYDIEGNGYLDFVAGIAVNALGYSHEKLKVALKKQIDLFLHCSNLYWNKSAIEASEKLVKLSGLDKVFFCNSGAEAVEGAMKLARKYAKKFVAREKVEIISMKNSFHGRTIAAITATGQEKYQKDLSPLLPGILYGEYNNLQSVETLINEKTCAIIIEPIQGEGGIIPAERAYLEGIRQLCDKHDIVLIFDEVQCGIGRTGHTFAYQHYNVKPDIVCLAKGLGSGVPVGGIIANEKVAKGFEPGDHASTFGGNPLAMAAVNVVMDEMLEENILLNVKKQGKYLIGKLAELKEKKDNIKDIRGVGLMQGIELIDVPIADVIKACMEKGLLLVPAGANVIRFVPPLVVKETDIDKAIEILESCL